MIKSVFILFLLASVVHSQEYAHQFLDEFCDCFSNTNEETGEACVQNTLSKYESFFLKEFQRKQDSINIKEFSYESGHKIGYSYGKKIFTDNIAYFVNNCSVMTKMITDTRNLTFNNIKKQSSNDQIKYYTEKINSYSIKNVFLFERGKQYFGLEMYKLAEKDFLECLSINSDDVDSKYYLAWIYERSGDLEKAITLLEEIISELPMNNEYNFKLMIIKQILKNQFIKND